jgi:hypothetical protein
MGAPEARAESNRAPAVKLDWNFMLGNIDLGLLVYRIIRDWSGNLGGVAYYRLWELSLGREKEILDENRKKCLALTLAYVI